MQRNKYSVLAVLCGSLALPVAVGCDGGNQQVRDEVVEPETIEGENLEVGDGAVTDEVNLDVHRPE